MARPRVAIPSTLWLAAVLLASSPAAATTLIHQSLEHLAADNDLIVRAKVIDTHSYWNADHTFILTDVHVSPLEALKGRPEEKVDLTFTLMGGTVGEVSILVVGGPELVPGSEYVLFLAEADLPGASDRLTVRDLGQGVFEVREGRALSQAFEDPLLPDDAGAIEVPGGKDGLLLDDLVHQIQTLVDR